MALVNEYGLAFYRDPETGGFYAINPFGDILTNGDWAKLNAEMGLFFASHSDEDIQGINAERKSIRGKPLSQSKRVKNGFVYLIKAANHYKIGITKNPESRLSSLSSNIGHSVELIHLLSSPDPKALEAHFHKIFEAKRVKGEWFAL